MQKVAHSIELLHKSIRPYCQLLSYFRRLISINNYTECLAITGIHGSCLPKHPASSIPDKIIKLVQYDPVRDKIRNLVYILSMNYKFRCYINLQKS